MVYLILCHIHIHLSAKILRHIDDVDVEVCRLHSNVAMAAVAAAVIAIPVAGRCHMSLS
jgi:hypothetical protein